MGGISPLPPQTVRAERSASEVEARMRKLLNELQLGINLLVALPKEDRR
jgi:hypothetical protein